MNLSDWITLYFAIAAYISFIYFWSFEFNSAGSKLEKLLYALLLGTLWPITVSSVVFIACLLYIIDRRRSI